MKTTDKPIIVEQVLDASKEDVWQAITSKDNMVNWYFSEIESFEPKVGFNTAFSIHHNDKTFTHLWTIIAVEPLQKVSYHWSYKEYKGLGLVTFELFDEGQQTRLQLTNEVLEDFPDDMEEFTTESCRAGWEYFLQESLKNYMS